jgi:hypothetical protein
MGKSAPVPALQGACLPGLSLLANRLPRLPRVDPAVVPKDSSNQESA